MVNNHTNWPDVTSGLRTANLSHREYSTFLKTCISKNKTNKKTCISFDPLLGIYLVTRLKFA